MRILKSSSHLSPCADYANATFHPTIDLTQASMRLAFFNGVPTGTIIARSNLSKHFSAMCAYLVHKIPTDFSIPPSQAQAQA